MNKDHFLKTICETAYNVGYAAKVNFATFDIIEKMPGLLGFLSLGVGVYALIIPALTAPEVGAAMVMVGIITLYLGMYQADKQRYDEVGKLFTVQFNELRKLYYTAKSRPDTADISDLIQAYDVIVNSTIHTSLSKQVLFSDWYAHYKFFWQQQIEWVDEQKHFRLFRDKVPLTAWAALAATIIYLTYLAAMKLQLLNCLLP